MTLQEVVNALSGKAALGDEDALVLRGAIYGAGGLVTRDEVEALFQLNAAAKTMTPAWRALFVVAAVDLIVQQMHPVGYVDDDVANWLVRLVKANPTIKADEVELLIRVLEQAEKTPERLSAFVLEVVKRLALWALARSGQLPRPVLEDVRRVVYAQGGDRNDAVTRAEAEALFDINDAMKGRAADPAWTDFFVKAVAASVLSDSPWRPDAAREAQEQAWLADPKQLLVFPWSKPRDAFTAELVHEGWRDLLHGRLFDHDMADAEAADEALVAKASALEDDEVDWLIARIGKDGRVDANEVALIDFIIANAAALSPAMRSRLEQLQREAA